MEASIDVAAQKIALATALGLVVGLERLRAGKEAGIRTFSLTAMAGCLSQMAAAPYLGAVVLILTGVIIVITNVSALGRGQGAELTTSVALMVTGFAGILVGQGQVFLPVASIISVLLLLAWKDEMVGFSHQLTREEVHAAITLLLLGAVILPVLPRGAVDPWNMVDLRKVWITVVLISGVGFVNYVLLRLYGARGVTYTGFLGGLVNSTATVAEICNQVSRGGPELVDYAFRGIMLAKAAMVLRNLLILAIVAPSALPTASLPVGLMLGTAAALAATALNGRQLVAPEVRLHSPFSLRSALAFGGFFLGLTVTGAVAMRLLGQLGFYAVSFFGGLVSSSSTAATAGTLARQGTISDAVAGTGLVVSCLASAVVLVPLVARAAKGTNLAGRMYVATALMIASAGMGLLLNAWLPELLPRT